MPLALHFSCMQQEDYVNLRTAKLLKEIGFNEPTSAHWRHRWYDEKSEWRFCNDWHIKPTNWNESEMNERYAAPSLYEAQQFLMEGDNGIIILPYINIYGYWRYTFQSKRSNDVDAKGNFSSYREALSAGVEYVAELLYNKHYSTDERNK